MAGAKVPFYAKEDLNIFLQDSFEELRSVLLGAARHEDRRHSSEVINDFVNLCNKVKRYNLPKQSSQAVRAFLSEKKPRSIDEVLTSFLTYGGPLKQGVTPASFTQPIRELVESRTVARALAALSEHFKGFAKDLPKAESLEDIFYLDPPFIHLAEYAEKYGGDFYGFLDDLEEAVAYLKQPCEDDSMAADPDEELAVHLMTVLRAKGREFHTVIVLDAIDGVWPSRLAITPSEKEQERRLFYVAVTRARHRLFILSHRTVFGERTTPSPFLNEMGLL